MTKKIALEELRTVIDEFNDFKSSLKEFAEFVADKKVRYSLSLDYGMGAFGICEMLDENTTWIVDLRD